MWDYILGLGEASFINISDFVTVQKSFPWMQTFSIWIIVLPYIWQLLCQIIADLCCKKRFLMKS